MYHQRNGQKLCSLLPIGLKELSLHSSSFQGGNMLHLECLEKLNLLHVRATTREMGRNMPSVTNKIKRIKFNLILIFKVEICYT